MKTSRLTLVLLVCMACTDSVGVVESETKSGGDGNATELLQAKLVPDCERLCQKLSSCPGVVSSCGCDPAIPATDCDCPSTADRFDECFGSCLSEIGGRYLHHSDTCANVGAAVLECFAALECATLTQSNAPRGICGFEAGKLQCPLPGDTASISAGSSSTGVGGSGSVEGTSDWGVAGRSDAVGGSGSASVGGASAGAVTCQGLGAESTGMIPDASPDGYHEQCDAIADNCSDGHNYRLTCSTSIEDTVTCYCIVDGFLQRTFQDPALLAQDSSAAACNSLGAANARCGWSLLAPNNAAGAL